ncbi:hypothetical protein EDM56_04240 [Brevibacillus fluminis]|uniref:Uncharacterized protein n=1 Tax=Brevibacillus fluminis TaxID=511487 RepID=A0A3M8DWS0_9BACL|nr:hypothetical protein EDM56_04240 [Brevibacillus fluminis]
MLNDYRFTASWREASAMVKKLKKRKVPYSLTQSAGQRRVEFVFSNVSEPQYFYLFLLFEDKLS